MKRFRAAVEAGDLTAAAACLAEDVVFESPVVHRPYHGRATVGAILAAAGRVFRDFRYVSELHAGGETALVFRARVGERDIHGVDLGRVDPATGLITHLTVFVRPLTGALALAEAMRAELEAADGGAPGPR